MSTVNTVLGPVETADLGFTLSHEHLATSAAGILRTFPELIDRTGIIEQANATRYGLSASIFTAAKAAQARFLTEVRAGCLNINCGTAGASSKLPFGGTGHSGNNRPTGAFSLDYCAYPVATMIEGSEAATVAQGMRVDRDWGK